MEAGEVVPLEAGAGTGACSATLILQYRFRRAAPACLSCLFG